MSQLFLLFDFWIFSLVFDGKFSNLLFKLIDRVQHATIILEKPMKFQKREKESKSVKKKSLALLSDE